MNVELEENLETTTETDDPRNYMHLFCTTYEQRMMGPPYTALCGAMLLRDLGRRDKDPLPKCQMCLSLEPMNDQMLGGVPYGNS